MNPKFQETPLAVIYGVAGIDVAALIAHGNARLADYQLPRYVAVPSAPLSRLAKRPLQIGAAVPHPADE